MAVGLFNSAAAQVSHVPKTLVDSQCWFGLCQCPSRKKTLCMSSRFKNVSQPLRANLRGD